MRGGGRSGKFTPFSCLSSVGTPPPSSFALRLILGLTHRQSLSAYTGLFRQRLLGRDCASLSGHLVSWMTPKAKYIPECYSINVKQPGVRLSNIAERPFSRQQINGNSVAAISTPHSILAGCPTKLRYTAAPVNKLHARTCNHQGYNGRDPMGKAPKN